jgi:hypothetical protein
MLILVGVVPGVRVRRTAAGNGWVSSGDVVGGWVAARAASASPPRPVAAWSRGAAPLAGADPHGSRTSRGARSSVGALDAAVRRATAVMGQGCGLTNCYCARRQHATFGTRCANPIRGARRRALERTTRPPRGAGRCGRSPAVRARDCERGVFAAAGGQLDGGERGEFQLLAPARRCPLDTVPRCTPGGAVHGPKCAARPRGRSGAGRSRLRVPISRKLPDPLYAYSPEYAYNASVGSRDDCY